MTREKIDTLWQQALHESVKAGEQFTRYHFAAKVKEHCAKICDDLPAPDSCTGIESSLWDVATLACGDAIRAGARP
jgi:hypothetical protein